MTCSRVACRIIAAAVVLPGALPGVVLAAEILPGQSGVNVPDQETRTLPAGTKLAEKTLPFTLDFSRPGDAGGLSEMTADGRLTTSVYREATGVLTFVYDVFVEPTTYDNPQFARPPVDELSEVVARGFGGLTTDLAGDFTDAGGQFFATRSADGSIVSGKQADGLGQPPLFIVRTNATAFDELGTVTFNAADEFLVSPQNDQVARDAGVTLTGTYRPVPEPAAAGLVVTGFAAAALRRRRANR